MTKPGKPNSKRIRMSRRGDSILSEWLRLPQHRW